MLGKETRLIKKRSWFSRLCKALLLLKTKVLAACVQEVLKCVASKWTRHVCASWFSLFTCILLQDVDEIFCIS